MINNYLYDFILWTLLWCVVSSCEQKSDNNGLSDNQIRGKVILENQMEHDGIIVYVSALNIAIKTNPDGEYTITLDDSINVDGLFPVYFYYGWYRVDSVQIAIEGNSILREQADVNEDGEVSEKQLTQIVAFNVSFDKEIYSQGDTLWVRTDIINRSGSDIMLGINFSSAQNPLFPIVVFNILSAENDSLMYWGAWPGDVAPNEILIEAGDTLNTFANYFIICTNSDSVPPCDQTLSYPFLRPGEYYWVPEIREMKTDDEGFYQLFWEVAVFPDLYRYLYATGTNYTFVIEGIYTIEGLDTFLPKAGIPSFRVQ